MHLFFYCFPRNSQISPEDCEGLRFLLEFSIDNYRFIFEVASTISLVFSRVTSPYIELSINCPYIR